jgi:hypothetical protein
MDSNEIRGIDEKLVSENLTDSILINKRGYFIYYNEPNKKHKIINIHNYNCGFCAWGSGRKIDNKIPGKNGVWIGPFGNIEQAKDFIIDFFGDNDFTYHSCC